MTKKVKIDFDGTCVTNEYPYMGKDIGAIPYLKQMVAKGAELILYTSRSGNELTDAINWFFKNDIKITYINQNPDFETGSRKIYGDFTIDDANVGTPMLVDQNGKKYVDWLSLKPHLITSGLL